MLPLQRVTNEGFRVEIVIGLVNKHRNLFFRRNFQNFLKLFVAVNVSHRVVRIQKDQQLRFFSHFGDYVANIHRQILFIRHFYKIPAVHFGINLKHEI